MLGIHKTRLSTDALDYREVFTAEVVGWHHLLGAGDESFGG
jgi:hypothetical protein